MIHGKKGEKETIHNVPLTYHLINSGVPNLTLSVLKLGPNRRMIDIPEPVQWT